MTPYEELAAARRATLGLLAHLDGLSTADLAAPSLLPGWTRAHVVAHLAGNARSHVRMLDGCLAGQVRTQYVDRSAREAGIAALAAAPERVVGEHAEAAAALERCWAALQPEHWDREVEWLDAGRSAAASTLWSRHKEVEVHRVDLDAGYRPEDWPSGFARRLLTRLLGRTGLPDMVVVADGSATGACGPRISGSPAALAAWLSGRTDGSALEVRGGRLPALPPWG